MSQTIPTKICNVVDLGRIPYGEALAMQESLVAARKAGAVGDTLLLCEHAPVITLGRNGKVEHLRVSSMELQRRGVEFHPTKRGGDITYHGPGQLVAYPILQLAEIRRDVVWYVRQLEEVMMRATAAFGVATVRVPGCTGVWIERAAATRDAGAALALPEKEKLGSIGVHISRWVTSHGFAYNVSTDLRHFDLIVPCGIAGCRTTSLETVLGERVPLDAFAEEVVSAFGEALGLKMMRMSREELEQRLDAAQLQPAGDR